MLTPNHEKIPQELKALRQWVVWKMGKDDKGRSTKHPYTPHNPQWKAKTNKSKTWSTFEKAVEVAGTDGFNGHGFVFSKDDPYIGIDIDKCRDPETGELKYCARILINSFNSYSEVSPRKRGIHIISQGKWPQDAGNKREMPCLMEVEVYDRVRFFTVTGAHMEGTPTTIEDRQPELEALHQEIFGNPKPNTKDTGPTYTLELAEQDLIGKAKQAVNGEKFTRLWDGDTTGHNSPSEADLALCSMLAFWCGPDSTRIDRLFRQSGLMRLKWDRRTGVSTYGAITIEKAISQTTEVYTPGRSANPNRGNGNRKDTGKPISEMQRTPEIKQTSSLIPVWPQEVMTGVAGAFAKTYSNYLETPISFLFMNFLTVLGHLLSDKVTLKSEISPQPRLYLVNLGESADTRKSTSIFKVISFFQGTIDPDDLNLIMGVGSAEGLAKALDTNPKGVLINDELKQLVNKMRIDSSVLLPCVCTLFELNTYHNQTQKHEIKIDDAQLCLLAASTLDTYQNMFSSQFLDIGFINRLFIVIGDSERKFPIPKPIPDSEKDSIRKDLKNVLAFWREVTIGGHFEIPIESEALDIFKKWYFSPEQSVFTKRLDTYGHRLMVLLAVNEMKRSITPEIAGKTISLLKYQLSARKFADPIDADNAIARVEEKIRRALISGNPVRKRDLERTCSKNRHGNWIWNAAIKNLRGSGEVGYDHKQKTYWLTPE
jgi:putative DNA primase/helicase